MAELDRPTRPVPRPLPALLTGENADIYFLRTERVLAAEGRNPVVTMEVFCRRAGATLCGIDEVKGLLAIALEADAAAGNATVWALKDGDVIEAKEIVLRIRAPYQSIARFETAYLGMMAHGTGWATASRAIVDAAAPTPVIAFGARHVHPNIADRLDYAAIIGGATSASTTAGSSRAGKLPVGTMPHALVLIYGDTVEAALAFERQIEPEVPRIVLVDTFRDESEESARVAAALGSCRRTGTTSLTAGGRCTLSQRTVRARGMTLGWTGSPVRLLRAAPHLCQPCPQEALTLTPPRPFSCPPPPYRRRVLLSPGRAVWG